MPVFTYVVRGVDGGESEKTIQAATLQDAKKRLSESGLPALALQTLRPAGRSIWVSTDDVRKDVDDDEPHSPASYAPMIETLRLYAGWLFAWYFLIYAFGTFALTRHLPWRSSVIESLFSSPIIANLSCAVFLFLMLSTLHRLTGRGALRGIVLTASGIVFLLLFAVNT